MMEKENSFQTKINSLAKDTGLFAISNFGSKILLFLLTPLYTSVLTAEEFGIADFITTTIYFVYPILTLSIAESTLRFAMEKKIDRDKVLSNSLIFILLSILLLLLVSPFIYAYNNKYFNLWIIFVCIYALYNIHNCISNYAKGIGKTKIFAIQGIIMTLTVIVSNIVFLVLIKIGLLGYLLSIILGYIIPIVIMVIDCKIFRIRSIFSLDYNLLKEMLKYSLPMIPTILAWSINTSVDKYMIIGIIGLDESGIYGVAHKVPTIFTTIVSVFTQAWQLSAIENYGSKGESEYYTIIYNHLDFISILGCMIISILCKPLASFLFNNEYYEAWRYVPLLTISAMFSCHCGFLASAFRASKKTKSLFYSVLVGAIVNIILNIILIPKIGALGAAIATAVSFMTTWIVRMVCIQKIVKLKLNIIKTMINYLFFLTMIIIVTIDIPHALLISIVILIFILFVNIAEIIEIFKLVSCMLKKTLKKEN